MQTQATYGLSGVGFTDPADNSYVGFSMTAGSLKITGGFEVVEQKNSAGVTVAAFNQVSRRYRRNRGHHGRDSRA